jgi:hypothetical protein
MTQKERDTDKSRKELPEFPILFAEMGKRNFEAMTNMQEELLDTVEEMNRDWLACAESEAALVSDFISKLTAARSPADTATACQEWMDRQMNLLAQDGRRLFADSQKFMQVGVRFLSNGSAGGST